MLVLAHGELERELLDRLIRAGVRRTCSCGTSTEASSSGPFVVPGRTACLRCIDAHWRLADPDHLPVLTRYVDASRRPRGDGGPDPVEPAAGQLAVAWAVRDLLAHVDGDRPTTWSRTLRLGPGPPGRYRPPGRAIRRCGALGRALLFRGSMGR